MCVQLVAHGQKDVEIGKYGMTLNEARNVFTEICNHIGLEADYHPIYRGVVIDFHTVDNEKLRELLYQVAYVENWRTDAPVSYILYEEIVPDKGYIKTDIYDVVIRNVLDTKEQDLDSHDAMLARDRVF